MKKTKFLREGVFIIACLILVFCTLAIIPNETAFAAGEKTYSTKTNIEKQGDNGFYYAWGTPSNYVLMLYGAKANGGGMGWRGLEIYQTVDGSALHPGNCWGVMVVWVANESGKVSLSGRMEKGTNQGDGVNLGVYHQHYGGELETLLEQFVDGQGDLEYPLDTELEVKKGDSLVFYCDSGKGKDNPNDASGCPFTITYTRRDGDEVADEDLSQYLSTGRAGDVGGFTHVEQNFAADNLDGEVVKTTKIENKLPILLAIIIPSVVVVVAVIVIVVVLVIRRKKK